MPSEVTDTHPQLPQQESTPPPNSSSQYGIPRLEQHASLGFSPNGPRSASPHCLSGLEDTGAPTGAVNAQQLEKRLRRLSDRSEGSSRSPKITTAGQVISDYEKALNASAPRQSLEFRVVKSPEPSTDNVRLEDFPNEILTHILSHLHPDSHGSVALVSKRFYALVTEPHAWRMAFLRFFPGQNALRASSSAKKEDGPGDKSSEFVRSEYRDFARLTSLASWRSEYLLRTRLLRSVTRGKPGNTSGKIGTAAKATQSGKRANAVLTYNSKLPWVITNIHAVFLNGKKPPRMIHGAGDMGGATASDPTSGKVEKWGLDDPFSFAQLDEVFPHLEFYGVGDGPAAVPNVMDVSQSYGMVGGEGFPGGRAYFRPTGALRGQYLTQDAGIIDMNPEIPKIPELTEGICSVWIAKSSAVPSMTHSMVGMMTGSTLGVVSTYALGYDSVGHKYSSGEMTARWVLSPGVPIIALKIDDNYNPKKKILGRVWAVALNALGEVFYLKDTPTPASTRSKGEDVIKNAWICGRSAFWDLVETTRRVPREDEFDKNAVRGAYSPRSPCNAMNLGKEQLISEAREIEKFLRHKPAHFRKVCDRWDMLRRLEVDFAAGDDSGAGESIFVITCGHEEDEAASILRFMRRLVQGSMDPQAALDSLKERPPSEMHPSIFGDTSSATAKSPITPSSPAEYDMGRASALGAAPLHSSSSSAPVVEEWRSTVFSLEGFYNAELTTSATDLSLCALLAPFEDPLVTGNISVTPSVANTPTRNRSTGEIPGRRARIIAVGTDSGAILLWNMREMSANEVHPVRIIQTESPEISSLALSALYLVHGGSDGLVQAWDPLASTLKPVRTLSSKSSGRVPRHILNANPALRHANFSVVGAIFLDPDPTVLRGVIAFGTFLRYWTYSSGGPPHGRKRRLRHSDIHGRLASRRLGGDVAGYIAAETEELRHEQEHQQRQRARLQNRFGVGFAEMTEEEALRYAQMVSEESFLLDEQRRLSASDTGSAADIGETASSRGSADTVTPDPSVSDISPSAPQASPFGAAVTDTDDDNYEMQIQQAIRLSLLEGVNEDGRSPRGNSSGDYDFSVKYKPKKGRSSPSSSTSPSESRSHTPLVQYQRPSDVGQSSSSVAHPARDDDLELALALSQVDNVAPTGSPGIDPDNDLELALRLGLQEHQEQTQHVGVDGAAHSGIQDDDFPALEHRGKGKRPAGYL